MKQALGLVEIEGLSTAIETADAMAKAANVELLEIENTRGCGYMTIKVAGDVGAVNAAVSVGRQTGIMYGKLVSFKVIPRPSDYVEDTFVKPEGGGPEKGPDPGPGAADRTEAEPERTETEPEQPEAEAPAGHETDQAKAEPEPAETEPERTETEPDQVEAEPDQVETEPDQAVTEPDQAEPPASEPRQPKVRKTSAPKAAPKSGAAEKTGRKKGTKTDSES